MPKTAVIARGRRLISALPLVVVVAAPAVASWHGLVAFGRDWAGLGVWAPLVPLVLDAAALYVAALAWRATLDGDSAGLDRILVWVYAGLSAGLNVWHANSTDGGVKAAIFYGAASLSAALIWERTLRSIRRRELREIGAIDAPAPRFRALRWLLPSLRKETYGAWKLAIREGITDAREAMTRYQLEQQAALTPAPVDVDTVAALEASPSSPRAKRQRLTPGEPEVAAERAPGFEDLTQRQALTRAMEELGAEATTAELRHWLAARGVRTDRSRANKLIKEIAAERVEQHEEQAPARQLAVVAGDR